MGAGYTTVAKDDFLIEHLGFAHDEDFMPLGTKSIFPHGLSADTKRKSSKFIDGASAEWSLEGGVTWKDVRARVGYSDSDQKISIAYFMQTECISVVHSGTLRKDVRIPENAKYAPYEVCIGHALHYTISLSEKSLRGDGSAEFDLSKAIGGGIIAKALARFASDFLTFEGSVEGFRNSNEVDVEVSSIGFGDSGSSCTAADLTSKGALACLKATPSTDSPVLVRWRKLEYDPLQTTDAGPARGKCRDYRLSRYRYDPPDETGGRFLVSIFPEGTSSTPQKGRAGELFEVTASAGQKVSYAVRRKVPGRPRPELLEEGSIAMPSDPREVAVSSHTGRLKVSVSCIRRSRPVD